MEIYILILTLLGSGNTGRGGLETIEFNSKTSCEQAGEKWKSVLDNSQFLNANKSFYLCVPK